MSILNPLKKCRCGSRHIHEDVDTKIGTYLTHLPTHKHSERDTQREGGGRGGGQRQTAKDRDRHTERDRDRQTDREDEFVNSKSVEEMQVKQAHTQRRRHKDRHLPHSPTNTQREKE